VNFNCRHYLRCHCGAT